MTRLVRLVLMLAFALGQAAAAECRMAPAGNERAPVPHAAMAHGGHDTHTPAHRQSAPDHGPAACALVMSCGAAAASTAEVAVPRLSILAARAPLGAARIYASPLIPVLAPPPKSLVAA